jgi:hypothetical protein
LDWLHVIWGDEGDMKSDAALLLSVAALLVSFAALYFNKLQPGRPVGGISYVMIWRFSNLPDGTETDFTSSPVLWIINVGARPLVIVNLRLRLTPEKSDDFYAYPTKIAGVWQTVCTNTLQFGSQPIHLRPLLGPGTMHNPVYTRR